MSLESRSSLEAIDLLDLDRWARDGAPYEWFARLRQEAPVWRHPSPSGSGFWVVSGYDDVVALGRCPHALSSAATRGGVAGLGPGDEQQAIQDEVDRLGGGGQSSGLAAMLLTLDPPEHTAYRKIVNKGFTPRMIAALEVRIRGLIDSLLDPLRPGDTIDLVTEFAMPLPMRVIAEMIGAPSDMHADLARWSNEAVGATDPEYRHEESAIASILQLFQAFDRIEDVHRTRPTEDLTSVLLSADLDGETLSPARFKMFLFLLAIAGNETTRNAISHAVWNLARHPDQWERLRADPSLVPTAVEEVIRYASPVLYFRRNAVSDMEIGGQAVETGDIVSLWYASANRDPAYFADPDRFDVGRDPNRHVGFGGGGPHFCLGASLARLEVRLVLEALIDRYDRIDVAGPVARLRSNFLHGIKHLPVRMAA